MFTREVERKLRRMYWQDYQVRAEINKIIRNAADFTRKSRKFLESDINNNERPFPIILHSATYLIEHHWSRIWPPDVPSTVEEMRGSIQYDSNLTNFFSEDVRFPIAAIFSLMPSLGRSKCFRLCWLLIRQLSYYGALHQILDNPSITYSEFIEIMNSASISSPLLILEDLRDYLEHVFDLLESYWDDHSSVLYRKNVFYPADFVRFIGPRIICANQNETIKVVIDLRRMVGRSVTGYGKDWLEKHHLIFSGGYNVPISASRIPGAGFNVDMWKIKPTSLIDGRQIHSGPINLIKEEYIQPVANYLRDLRQLFEIITNRCWLPWNTEETNFLWVGKPYIEFSPPKWLFVSDFRQDVDVPFELWGVEHFDVSLDGASTPVLSCDVTKNHKVKKIALEMEKRSPIDSITRLYPKKYKVNIQAKNICGSVSEIRETGVTYRLKLHYLGADIGQTISIGSQSPYPDLRVQPAYVGFFGTPIPINPPLVPHKLTWIRIYFEHDAPLPYFAFIVLENTVKNFLSCTLTYSIRKEGSNEVIQEGILGNEVRYFSISNEGVLQISDDPEIGTHVNFNNYQAIRDRNLAGYSSFEICFYPIEIGTYYIQGTVDIRPYFKEKYGISNAQTTFNDLVVNIVNSNKVKFYWIPFIPKDNWCDSNQATYCQLMILSEWVNAEFPSIEFEFNYYLQQEYKQGDDSDFNRIMNKLEDIRGDNDGFFLGIIDNVFYSHLDDSMPKNQGVDGVTRGYGNRIAIVESMPSSNLQNQLNWRSIAYAIGHEFGHAHPNGYRHQGPCTDQEGNLPIECVPSFRYFKPDKISLYPESSCGERIFYSFPGISGSPLLNLSGIIIPEMNRDIMTYCGIGKFELIKCVHLLEYHEDL